MRDLCVQNLPRLQCFSFFLTFFSQGGYQAVKVHFHAEILGEFNEEVSLAIDGSPAVGRLVLHGTVVGPSIHFDMPKLNFGTVRAHVNDIWWKHE